LENAIFLEEDTTSRWRFGINLAEARNDPVGRLSATVAESIIFRTEVSILLGWEEFSTSSLRMPFFVGKFQLPAGGLVLGLDRIPLPGREMFVSIEKFQLLAGELISAYQKIRHFLVRGLGSTHMETILFRPEDYMRFTLEKFRTSGWSMQ